MSEGEALTSGRFQYLGTISAVGLVVLAFGICSSQFGGWLAGIGISSLIFLSSSAVGGAFGFLFAVPRILSEGESQLETDNIKDNRVTNKSGIPSRLLRSNTNLERISDWLTTMLVGVGLSQVGSINDALDGFRVFISANAKVFSSNDALSSAGVLPAIGPMILIFGIVLGFIGAYLYTRIILSGSFNKVEKDLNNVIVEKEQVSGSARDVLVDAAKALAPLSSDPTIQKIADSSKTSVADGLDVMLTLLYQLNGYKRVIDLAGEFSGTPLVHSGEYWFYLAAAYGQQHRALRDSGAVDRDLVSSRENMMDAARRAIEIDRSFIGRLWAISDPGSTDNDLSDFRDDADFRRLVRRPIAR